MPIKLISAVSLWTAAITMQVTGIVIGQSALRSSAVLVALMACVPSLWLVFTYEVSHAQAEVVASICRAIGYTQAEESVRSLR